MSDLHTPYHELLAAGDPLGEWEALQDGMRARGLTFGARPVCTVLRPMLIERARLDGLLAQSRAFYGALGALYRRLMADDALRATVGLTEVEEAALHIEPGFASPDGIGRLDAFVDEGGTLRFVEYNADSPGGLAFGHALGELFLGLPTMRTYAEGRDVAHYPAMDDILATLLAHYRAWGGLVERPRIGIVDWEGLGTAPEFALCREHFERAGYPALVTHPGALELRWGRLWDSPSGQAVDIVYKRVLVGELLARLGLDNILTAAMRQRAACVVNSYRAQLLFKKALFALLSEMADGDALGGLDGAQAAALRRNLPWTRLVREGTTRHEGQTVDLLPYVAERRERFALKPNSEYGGAGVVLGWEVDDERWQRTLATAVASETPWIVQERILVATEPFPFVADGALRVEQRFMDLDPYTFGPLGVRGAGVRLGSGGLLNVTAGAGSAVPLMVVTERQK